MVKTRALAFLAIGLVLTATVAAPAGAAAAPSSATSSPWSHVGPARASAALEGPALSVTPSTGLTGPTVVTGTGTGLTPGSQVGFGQCDSTGSVCDGTLLVTVGADGSVTINGLARTVIDLPWLPNPPTPVDCRVDACTMVLVDSGFSVIATAPLAFTAGATPTAPPVTVTPDHDLVDGQKVVLDVPAGNYFPGLPFTVGQCMDDPELAFLCDDSGRFSTVTSSRVDGSLRVTLNASRLLEGIVEEPTIDCAPTGCAMYLRSPAFGDLAVIPLGFDPNPHDAPANDDVGAAVAVSTLPFSDHVDTTGATVAANDPGSNCFEGPVATVWYTITPATSLELEVNTVGSDYDTTLAVYTGDPGSLTEIACSNDTPDPPAALAFPATAGTTYLVMAGTCCLGDVGQVGPGGALAITFRRAPPHVAVRLSVDRFGTVSRSGRAVVRGSDRCTTEATVFVTVRLTQRTRAGTVTFINQLPFPCSTTTQRWSVPLDSPDAHFMPGRVRADIEAFATNGLTDARRTSSATLTLLRKR